MASPFVFFDLRTSDVSTARRFYSELLGWTVADVPAGNKAIPMLMGQTGPWGGFTQLSPDDGREPQWIPYAPVDDLDATTEQAKSLGAAVLRERTELPEGSLVVITDPTGATLVLWEARKN